MSRRNIVDWSLLKQAARMPAFGVFIVVGEDQLRAIVDEEPTLLIIKKDKSL